VGKTADVYAIGAILYYLIAGRAPYEGAGSCSPVHQVQAGPPAPIEEQVPNAPDELVAITKKAMDRAPERRYATAHELAQDLRRFQSAHLVHAYIYHRSGECEVRGRGPPRAIGECLLTSHAIGACASKMRSFSDAGRSDARAPFVVPPTARLA
jgi:serine/threonine protein kinase